jgi:hypothetical protein
MFEATNAFGASRGHFYLGALKACFQKRTNENAQAAQQRRRLGNAERCRITSGAAAS